MAFSPPALGCLVKKGLQKGGQGHPRTPLVTPLQVEVKGGEKGKWTLSADHFSTSRHYSGVLPSPVRLFMVSSKDDSTTLIKDPHPGSPR